MCLLNDVAPTGLSGNSSTATLISLEFGLFQGGQICHSVFGLASEMPR